MPLSRADMTGLALWVAIIAAVVSCVVWGLPALWWSLGIAGAFITGVAIHGSAQGRSAARLHVRARQLELETERASLAQTINESDEKTSRKRSEKTATILHWCDSRRFRHGRGGLGGTVRFTNGEPVTLSFSRFSGVRVRKSRFGFFGPTLYEQRDTYIAARTGVVLSHLYPDRKFPAEVSDLNLRSYLNAILHCESAAEVSRVLHQAEEVRPTDDLAEGLPDWALPPERLGAVGR